MQPMGIINKICAGSDISSSEKEVLSFGYDMLKTAVIGLAVALVIGLALGELYRAILFIITLLPLRQNAGGYHAKTRKACALISLFIYISVLLIFRYAALNGFV